MVQALIDFEVAMERLFPCFGHHRLHMWCELPGCLAFPLCFRAWGMPDWTGVGRPWSRSSWLALQSRDKPFPGQCSELLHRSRPMQAYKWRTAAKQRSPFSRLPWELYGFEQWPRFVGAFDAVVSNTMCMEDLCSEERHLRTLF